MLILTSATKGSGFLHTAQTAISACPENYEDSGDPINPSSPSWQ